MDSPTKKLKVTMYWLPFRGVGNIDEVDNLSLFVALVRPSQLTVSEHKLNIHSYPYIPPAEAEVRVR